MIPCGCRLRGAANIVGLKTLEDGSLIGSFFSDVRIYAYPNNGGWYDIGFVINAAAFYSGGDRSPEKCYYLVGYEQGAAATRSRLRNSN
jgi:hypothetical protein